MNGLGGINFGGCDKCTLMLLYFLMCGCNTNKDCGNYEPQCGCGINIDFCTVILLMLLLGK